MGNSIILNKKDGVATIRLNRPAVFNAFNNDMRKTLLDALWDCSRDETIRCVLIIGEGKAFCAGQDLAEIANPDTAPSFSEILDDGFNDIVLTIRRLEKPVVAAVNGVAAGAGANLALACDIVVATQSASFIQAFSKIGLIPDTGGTFTLPRLIGFGKASAIMMLGDKISAQDASEMGMIYKAVADEDFQEEIQCITCTLAAMPTRGLALTKQALNHALSHTLVEQLAVESELQAQAGVTIDYREGVTAFIEKRKPHFIGK